MDDTMILDLYHSRSESAITETASKYGSYCLAIATNILKNREDAEECVNDTYLKAWEAIPPERPIKFRAFLCKITRNLSLNKYEAKNAQKRGGNFSTISKELEQCLPAVGSVEDNYDVRETGECITVFLRSLEKEHRVIFVRRYWYGDCISMIAQRLNISNSKIKSSLFRTRNKLKTALESEGIFL